MNEQKWRQTMWLVRRGQSAWRVLSVDTHVTEGDFTFDVVP
jgi:hypothetical protein